MPRIEALSDILWAAGAVAGIIACATLIHRLVLGLVRRIARDRHNPLECVFVQAVEQPVSWLVPLMLLLAILPTFPLLPPETEALRHVVLLAIISVFAWIAFELMNVVEAWLNQRYKLRVDETLASRKLRTQIVVLRRVAVLIIVVFSVAAAIMTFPSVWHIGMGMFASAGLAGLLAGAAARPALSNVLAGVQVAFSDLIHVDDIVTVEGQWGRIEEIGATNVFIRLGDLRRLIVPLSYFMEHSFQDWSRTAEDLFGTVNLYVDFSAPVDDLRRELHIILESSPLWDHRQGLLQVTNITEHTMELRAVLSAADAESCWNLSCHVREELMRFLHQNYPEALPRYRAQLPVPVSSVHV